MLNKEQTIIIVEKINIKLNKQASNYIDRVKVLLFILSSAFHFLYAELILCNHLQNSKIQSEVISLLLEVLLKK